MNKVSGAVNGVDDPFIFSIGVDIFVDGFFASKSVIRVGRLQRVNDDLLHIFIDIGDVVIVTFFSHLDEVWSIKRSRDFLTCQTSSSCGNISHWLHGLDPDL